MRNKLDNLYSEMNSKYNVAGTIDEEKIKKDVEVLNKQIMGMKLSLSKTTDENKKKSLAEGIRKAEARKNNFEGYTKYHTQIDKIQGFKKQLSGKLTKLKTERENSPKELEKLEKELKSKNELGQDLNKKNKDEKYTMNLSNDEYNKLQEKLAKTNEEIETLKKKIKDLKEKMELYDKKIKDIEGKIGKCDLAWKTLYTNKGWDEIQKRAVNDSKRYEVVKKENNKDEKTVGENEVKEAGEKKAPVVDNKESDQENALVKVKPSLFNRFKNAMKKAYNGVKEYFFGPDGNSGREYVTEERKAAIQEERKEAAEKAKAEEEKNLITQKDKFLEGLRTSVDIDYKNKKEQTYNNKYQKTVNKNQTKTNTIENEKEMDK